MKKFIAFAAAAALLTSPVLAFAHESGKKGPDRKIERLKEKLGLTDDQTAKVRAIFDDTHTKMQALMEQTRTQIKAVLTPEQQAKYDQMKKDWEQKREERKEEHKAQAADTK
jgi:Spy/CpxP family protein refolding chaperone